MTEPFDHQRPSEPPPAGAPAPPVEEPEEARPRPAPWVGLLTALGLGLAAVITAQVLTAIAEGMALKSTEPQGIQGDTFHRLGYAFGGLGGTAVLFLVLAVVLVSLPPILDA